MNLLKDGIAQHTVEKTTLTRKLTLDGLTKAYPVYKVRLVNCFITNRMIELPLGLVSIEPNTMDTHRMLLIGNIIMQSSKNSL